jgi:hypothetical protein
MKFIYDTYNREERAICSHLFRLLHERLENKWNSSLGLFLLKLVDHNPDNRLIKDLISITQFNNIGIFTEVAIIRDAYVQHKPEVNDFMDSLVKIIMLQEKVSECRLYSQLDNPINNPNLTHPKQIRQKADAQEYSLSNAERIVYGALQGMFNAKPDLVITINNYLLVFEAKLTLKFDNEQILRTKNIAQVWAKLLYEDLGFEKEPEFEILKLGAARYNPDISWEEIFDIVQLTYYEKDRTYIAMESCLELLK